MIHCKPNEGATCEWLTPPEIIAALGPFDLDPCVPIRQPWPTAREVFTLSDDGLQQEWRGRVFLNPPYGRETWKWMRRLAEHGNGIAMIFARTDTEGFHRWVFGRADAILFMRGRPHFHHANGERAKGNSGGAVCLVAYGQHNVIALKRSPIDGKLVAITR